MVDIARIKQTSAPVWKSGVSSLETALTLLQSKPSLKSLAVDFELWELRMTEFLELGVTTSICIWDTETETVKEESPVIEHIVFQENVRRRNGIYCADERDNFAFGKTEIWPKHKIQEYLIQLIDTVDFLIFHSQSEFKYFKNLGITIDKPVLDTQLLAATIGMKIPSLTRLLESLEVPVSAMHNAGNDAYCTLLAFLALVNTKSQRATEEQFMANCIAWEEEKLKKKQEAIPQPVIEIIFAEQTVTLTAANLRQQLPPKQTHVQKPADASKKQPFFLHRLLLSDSANQEMIKPAPLLSTDSTTRKRKFVIVNDLLENPKRRKVMEEIKPGPHKISSVSLLALLSPQKSKKKA